MTIKLLVSKKPAFIAKKWGKGSALSRNTQHYAGAINPLVEYLIIINLSGDTLTLCERRLLFDKLDYLCAIALKAKEKDKTEK